MCKTTTDLAEQQQQQTEMAPHDQSNGDQQQHNQQQHQPEQSSSKSTNSTTTTTPPNGVVVVEDDDHHGSTTKKMKTDDNKNSIKEEQMEMELLTEASCCGLIPPSHVQTAKEMKVWDSSLEDRANCISKWLLTFLSPLLRLGSHKVLEVQDIGVVSKQDRADMAYESVRTTFQLQTTSATQKNQLIQQQYEKKLSTCRTDEERKHIPKPELIDPGIATALIQAFGKWRILLAIFFYVISALLGFVPVLILRDLVRFFESGLSINEYQGMAHPWTEVAALGVVPVIISLLQTRHQVIMAHCATFVRTSVSTMLYRKALRVSALGRSQTSTGQVVNMMSNDTSQLQRFLQFFGMIIVAPIQIVLALYLIFQQVGNATWVGVGYMVFLVPINMVIFGIVAKQRREVLKYSDMRVKMMNEILSGIRIIKFYAWERPFNKEVAGIRHHELIALTKLAYTSAIGFSLILLATPLIQPILVFLTYVSIQSAPLTASTAFTTVALFNLMRFPFAFLPMGLLQYIQARIALRRLGRYLDFPELSDYVEYTAPPPNVRTNDINNIEPTWDEPGSITIQNGSFSWSNPDAAAIRPIQEEKKRKGKPSKNSENMKKTDASMALSGHSVISNAETESSVVKAPVITLQDITCHINAGSLIAVVGPVGCGKSSFLGAMLGEMEPISGSKVYMPRDDKDAGEGYISYCAQTPWVVNATLRENILFGRTFDQERYDQVVEACALLDDLAVLPAGDATEIGERGINLSGGQKARVSLARALYYKNTRIMLMDDPLSAVDAHVGEHIFSNAITGELSRGVTRILVTHHVHLLSRCDSVIVLESGRIKHAGKYSDLVANGVDFAGAIDVMKVKKSTEAAEEENDSDNVKTPDDKKDDTVSAEKKAAMTKSGKKLVKDEEREEGSVAGSAYYHYAAAGGVGKVMTVLGVQSVGRATEVISGFWLALWAARASAAYKSGQALSHDKTLFYLSIYAAFGLFGVLCLTLRSLVIAVHRMGASKKLHNNLTESVLRAPVSFFDVTPTGRVLNRFAADMDKVDLELTQSLSQGISTLYNVLGAIAAIIIATKGVLIIPLIPISVIYFVIQKWYRKTSTELQRVTSILNSPIFADFSQTLSGTSTIRAYGSESRFFTQCKDSFDTMNASYLLVQLCNCWLGLRLDFLGGLVGAMIAGLAVSTHSSHFIPAGWLGLALSYSIEVTGYLKHGVQMLATIEAQMNSVERILFYTDHIKPEAPEFIEGKDPSPDQWPKQGKLELRNASMRYRDGPLVLKGVSLEVKGGEKVGVCGRTGSGKSSLMVALFRISEIEQDGGMITIDDVNTGEIGISALRLNLSIIPQDPIIFSNTVRFNLDPFSRCSDEEIWEVLEKVQMKDVVAGLPGALDMMVAEGGENFSQGQRQLLCIGRALLRKPKVLVMDEATASIDNATDAAIQTMIRENFANATVLTIAHRLNTIMDSDRVLVLDDGRVAEFDSPQNLLQREDSLFKAMVEKSKAAKSVGH